VSTAPVCPYHSLFLRVHSAEKLQPLYPKDIVSGGNKDGNLFYCKVYLGPKAMKDGSTNNQKQKNLSKWLLGESHSSDNIKEQESSNSNCNVEIFKTKVEAGGKSHSPVWNEKLSFKSYRSDMPQILTIRVKDSHSLLSASIGACVINLRQFPVGQTLDQFFPIYNTGTKEPTGRLRLQLLVSNAYHEDQQKLMQQQLLQQKYEHSHEAQHAKSTATLPTAYIAATNQEEEVTAVGETPQRESFYDHLQYQQSRYHISGAREFEAYEDDDDEQNQLQNPSNNISDSKQKKVQVAVAHPNGFSAATSPIQYATHTYVPPNPTKYQHQLAPHQYQYLPLESQADQKTSIPVRAGWYGLCDPVTGAAFSQQYESQPLSQAPVSTQPAYHYQSTPLGPPPAYRSQLYRPHNYNAHYYGAIPHVTPGGQPASYRSPCGPAPLVHPLSTQIPTGPPPPYNLDSSSVSSSTDISADMSNTGSGTIETTSESCEQMIRRGSFDL
jgi:hypothetical protein